MGSNWLASLVCCDWLNRLKCASKKKNLRGLCSSCIVNNVCIAYQFEPDWDAEDISEEDRLWLSHTFRYAGVYLGLSGFMMSLTQTYLVVVPYDAMLILWKTIAPFALIFELPNFRCCLWTATLYNNKRWNRTTLKTTFPGSKRESVP